MVQYYEEISLFPHFSCRNRCSHCCHDNPSGLSGWELQRIAQHVLQRPDATQIHERLQQLAARYRNLPAADPQSRQLRWKALGIPCVFLFEGQCSIYEERPLACRSFFALTPSDLCHTAHPDHQLACHPQFVGPQQFHDLLFDLSHQYGLVFPKDLICGLAQCLEETNI